MKNKIHNYDFLIVGAGLIGSLTALRLCKSKYNVLIIDKNTHLPKDKRTLAVNANSKDFLKSLSLWDKLKSKPEPIKKIIIKDYINKSPLVFENNNEEMGNVIFNKDLLLEAKKDLLRQNLLLEGIDISIKDILPYKKILIRDKTYIFKNIILSLGKKYEDNSIIRKYSFPNNHFSYVGFFNHANKHNQTAYEIFTPDGPLAVLPSPDKSKKKSTFIYSSKKSTSKIKINSLIKKYFTKTHGSIILNNNFSKFSILPHLSIDNFNKYILIGDNLRSIHPVAGQGWNLGVKDIQYLDHLLELNSLNNFNFIKKYYSSRSVENVSYLSFTSSLNLIYENQNLLTKFIIKTGFNALKNFSFLRKAFIKQAMGRSNLIG
tara:strand:+ start:977 stop:2101 length:1125 start_codon:yes stop_codon:yes gene_type:complete